MELTDRQEKILHSLVESYINLAEPISSELLKKEYRLDVSPATIRNELQALTELGYIAQPHTSAGRVPTNKGYRYFIEIIFTSTSDEFPNFILKEVEEAKQKIEQELKLARDLAKLLEQMASVLDFNRIEEDMLYDILKIIGTSRTTYDKNIDVIKELLKEFENF